MANSPTIVVGGLMIATLYLLLIVWAIIDSLKYLLVIALFLLAWWLVENAIGLLEAFLLRPREGRSEEKTWEEKKITRSRWDPPPEPAPPTKRCFTIVDDDDEE